MEGRISSGGARRASVLLAFGVVAVSALLLGWPGVGGGATSRGSTRSVLRTLVVTGRSQVGTTLLAQVWVGRKRPAARTAYGYRWALCDWSAANCTPDGVGRRYQLTAKTVGRRLQVTAVPKVAGLQPLSTLTAIVVPQGPLVVAAAGDIACDPTSSSFKGGAGTTHGCKQVATSNLISGSAPAAVLALGDNQYECGDASAWPQSFGPSWGRFKTILHPAIGNHEYGNPCHRNDATPYFDYFGSAAGPPQKGWYSYDIGAWHFIALNSECSYGTGSAAVGGCGSGSPEERWLAQDLAKNKRACTIAYWHEPRFSSGEHGDATQMATIWNDLVAAHADVVLSGHNHDYERFAPIGATEVPPASPRATSNQPVYQQPQLDPAGITEFVVGTGGRNLYGFGAVPPLQGEVFRSSDTFGVLLLTLQPTDYAWQFKTTDGTVVDSGSAACN
jgi:hypothetical protein